MVTNTRHKNRGRLEFLEAFAMYNGRPRFIILLLADPHLLEGGQGCKDGTPDPD